MPLKVKKMPKRFHKTNFYQWLLLAFSLSAGVFLVVTQTQKRTTSLNAGSGLEISNLSHKEVLEEFVLQQTPKPSPKDSSSQKTDELNANELRSDKDVWCEVKAYKDLSRDPIFTEFTDWLNGYNDLLCKTPGDCLEHDPRVLANYLDRGVDLARARKTKLNKIIRGGSECGTITRSAKRNH